MYEIIYLHKLNKFCKAISVTAKMIKPSNLDFILIILNINDFLHIMT